MSVLNGSGPGFQAPYFFLSFKRRTVETSTGVGLGDPDELVVQFYTDLCDHIRELTDLDESVDAGYLDRGMRVGTLWDAKVNQALATCRTFVPLYRPGYFESRWCGYEWAAFEARQAEHVRRTSSARCVRCCGHLVRLHLPSRC